MMNMRYRVVTDGLGNYSFSGLSDGEYKVYASAVDQGFADQYYSSTIPGDPSTVEPQNGTSLFINGGDTQSNINFALQPGGSISGTVYNTANETLGYVVVMAGIPYFGVCTDGTGRYTLSGLPLNFPIFMSASGSCTNGEWSYARQWWDHKSLDGEANSITLQSHNPNRIGIDFHLVMGGAIRGTVTDQITGHTIGNVHIRIHYNYWDGPETCSNEDGSFLPQSPP